MESYISYTYIKKNNNFFLISVNEQIVVYTRTLNTFNIIVLAVNNNNNINKNGYMVFRKRVLGDFVV